MKRFAFLLTVIICLSAMVLSAFAAVPVPTKAGTSEIQVILDGKTLAFGDVAPQNIGGRILVPLRAIFEEMGADVAWEADTSTVTATGGSTVVVLTIGDVNPTINGSVVNIDVPGMIVEGRTLAPLRFVAEAFGGTVVWDADTNTANITKEAIPPDGFTEVKTTTLLYQGHGSYRITSADGTVIFIDPYIGEGYDKPADIILVTHQHGDHNQIQLVTQKTDCVVISNAEALEGGKHNSFDVKNIHIEAVEASNANHNPAQCVGFIITVDGIKIYAAGDTSRTTAMEGFATRQLDYALYPCDGRFNMDLAEAAECAELIGAKHNIPIHLKSGELFDRDMAEAFDAPNKLIVEPGEEITLDK